MFTSKIYVFPGPAEEDQNDNREETPENEISLKDEEWTKRKSRRNDQQNEPTTVPQQKTNKHYHRPFLVFGQYSLPLSFSLSLPSSIIVSFTLSRATEPPSSHLHRKPIPSLQFPTKSVSMLNRLPVIHQSQDSQL